MLVQLERQTPVHDHVVAARVDVAEVGVAAQQLGYSTVFWSLAYVDWYTDDQPTPEQAFSKLLPRIHPGAVVLLHSTSSTNAEILDELLTKWEEMGYSFGDLEAYCAAQKTS